MKKTTLLTLLLAVFPSLFFAQSSGRHGNLTYTFGYNEVPDNCNLPLIGIVNVAHGNQKSFHIGMVNTTEGNMGGAQIGFINTVGDGMDGIQIAFVNTTGDNQLGFQCGFINTIGDAFTGIQTGFINTVGDNASGVQVGFINTLGDNAYGVQVGFINAIGDRMRGSQIGFINAVGDKVQGAQIGFVNGVERLDGFQVGFINGTRVLNGLQVGFVNSVDRVEHGVPIGFLSFVHHGGYQAFEFSFNEMYPYNASYKIGMDKFYTFPMVSYNPNRIDPWAIGFGAGSVIPMNEEVFFNPELMSQTVVSSNFQEITSLGLQFGHAFTENVDFLAGPSLVWSRTTTTDPMFSLHNWDLGGSNRLNVGFRLALRYRFQN